MLSIDNGMFKRSPKNPLKLIIGSSLVSKPAAEPIHPRGPSLRPPVETSFVTAPPVIVRFPSSWNFMSSSYSSSHVPSPPTLPSERRLDMPTHQPQQPSNQPSNQTFHTSPCLISSQHYRPTKFSTRQGARPKRTHAKLPSSICKRTTTTTTTLSSSLALS